MKYLTILGSTGSIGINTLAVVKKNPDKFTVRALVAGNNVALMTKQCLEFHPSYAYMADANSARALKTNLASVAKKDIKILSGGQAACELATLEEVDTVMAAIVGVAGLLPTIAALRAGKRVLLANKEALVTCGQLFMKTAHQHNSHLLPVDSEHNAIFQSLPEPLQHKLGYASLTEYGISHIILTSSGGPFRQIPLTALADVTPEQTCAHPNWLMGRKISVDSATMMNKGLEYIEARWLFNASTKQIEILLHPQSIIHGMVRYIDGSVLAQLSSPDMRTPIAYALAYPERVIAEVKTLDFIGLGTLSFDVPDIKRYPCLQLAIEASACGQAATTILNAANEIAVAAFLHRIIRFTEIYAINHQVLEQLTLEEPKSLEDVLAIDRQAREKARLIVNVFRR